MISISRVKAATAEFIKVLRFGRQDIQTADAVLPHGIDSKPVKNTRAVHATSTNREDSLILGYLYKSSKTAEGETRLYATNDAGEVVFDIKLKNDGTAEIGGTGDFMVRYNSLESGLDTFVLDLNTKLTAAFTAVGGSWPGTSVDISGSKIDDIKVPE